MKLSIFFLPYAIMALTACGRVDGASAIPPSPVAPVVTSNDLDFSAIEARVANAGIDDIALVVGDASGPLYTYEQGRMLTSKPLYIASATKLLLGLTAWKMVEDDQITPVTRPTELIDFWTSDLQDARWTAAFEQFFSLTSGFNGQAGDDGCIGKIGYTLAECVENIHDDGLDTQPGNAFSYGNEHMQIAGLMMTAAAATDIDTIMREKLLAPLGVSAETRYPHIPEDNFTYSGGMRSTGDDYAKVLTALLGGRLVERPNDFLKNRLSGTPIAEVPHAISSNGLDWRYGWGFWIECDHVTFTPECESDPVISSAGAFGFTPWIDFENGYWAIIIMQEPLDRGFDPAQFSIQLEQDLQPLIEHALR
ncbi:MAG: serine hydrolase domain-containing protein [Pseudomonadota bacterium]